MFQSLFAALAPFDHAVVVALNAGVGRWPAFDEALHRVSANGLFKGFAFVAVLWWIAADEFKRTGDASDYAVRCILGLISAQIATNFEAARGLLGAL